MTASEALDFAVGTIRRSVPWALSRRAELVVDTLGPARAVFGTFTLEPSLYLWPIPLDHEARPDTTLRLSALGDERSPRLPVPAVTPITSEFGSGWVADEPGPSVTLTVTDWVCDGIDVRAAVRSAPAGFAPAVVLDPEEGIDTDVSVSLPFLHFVDLLAGGGSLGEAAARAGRVRGSVRNLLAASGVMEADLAQLRHELRSSLDRWHSLLGLGSIQAAQRGGHVGLVGRVDTSLVALDNDDVERLTIVADSRDVAYSAFVSGGNRMWTDDLDALRLLIRQRHVRGTVQWLDWSVRGWSHRVMSLDELEAVLAERP